MTAGSARDLSSFLTRERDAVEQALGGVVARLLPPAGTPLREAMAYALSTTGKRLRPVLCVAAYRASRPAKGPVPVEAYRLACALEVVHTYSLVHDDLPCMDDDDLRRGRPTVHRVFGSGGAILAGAALLPLAVTVLDEEAAALGLGESARAALVAELCRAAGAEGMVGGQLLDLEAEGSPVDAGRLEEIHRAKTGALLAASLRIGALAADAAPQTVDALTRYGEALGLAFQIMDDVLDVAGDTHSLGKTAGRDQALNKASYPALFGLDGARSLARDRAQEAKGMLTGLDAPELIALADFVVERRR